MQQSVEVGSTVFVTGMQRSGTTLLEKLLASHPHISLLSQPFPFLFREAKRELYRRRGWEVPAYPLGPLFLENYEVEDLTGHLSTWRIDAALLRTVFAAMDGYSGQYTRFEAEDLERALDRLVPGDLAAVVAALYRTFSRGTPLCGGKETLCEEFLPYLLDRGLRGAVILRDPRDVLASLNHGRGREHAGRFKPTLFNLRNWRKSVAFALHLEGNPRFTWIRYEDLTAHPLETLNRMTPVLQVEPFADDSFAAGITGNDGRAWAGNSSHGSRAGISRASVGIHQAVLAHGVTRFVEAVCYPELKCLGYPVSLAWDEIHETLRGFEDPYTLEREDLAEYGNPAVIAAQEIRRVELLVGPASAAEARRYFVFPDVQEALRRAVLSK